MERRKLSVLYILIISIVPLLLLGIGVPLCFEKNGFSVRKISSKEEGKGAWEPLPCSQEMLDDLCHQVFSQRYRYLGSGHQCYAFESEDEQFVIKFFKTEGASYHGVIEKFFLLFPPRT